MKLRLPEIKNEDDLCEIVTGVGFLPFFKGEIEGFSLEEACRDEFWFEEGVDGPWEWKGQVIRDTGCAYGKFYRGKACFVSREWFFRLACHRRRGLSFEESASRGLVRHEDVVAARAFAGRSMCARELKAAAGVQGVKRTAFDARLMRLQMQCFVTIDDFEYNVSASGEQYGWGVARYALADDKFGDVIWKGNPDEAHDKIYEYLADILPDISPSAIERLIG